MEVGGGGGGGNQGEVPKNHAREKNVEKIVHSKQPGKILALTFRSISQKS